MSAAPERRSLRGARAALRVIVGAVAALALAVAPAVLTATLHVNSAAGERATIVTYVSSPSHLTIHLTQVPFVVVLAGLVLATSAYRFGRQM